VSFVDVEDDHTGEKPAYGVAGFTKDGKSVALDHRHDLWLVPLDGMGAARNLTNGVGGKNDIRFRYLAMDEDDATPAFGAGGGGAAAGAVGAGATIDLSKPIMLTAFGTKTKKAGFYQLDGGQTQPGRLRGSVFSVGRSRPRTPIACSLRARPTSTFPTTG
jgi:hypothetical protein